MKKKLSLADIKAGILIDTPEKITVEIMVSGDQAYVIRERETIESLWENERLLP